MNAAPRVRLLAREDLPFADSLRALAGWNQTAADWERFVKWDPAGCFLAEWEGNPAGVVTTITYGRELAWIGMALVHPDFRRRGIGRALLERSVDYLRGKNIRRVKLDATPQGKPLYEKLGFQEEWSFKRWERQGESRENAADDCCVRPWRTGDAELVEAIDTEAFGVNRRRLIESLASQSSRAFVHEVNGTVEGYGLLRPGSRAFYLGPVVARSSAAGAALVANLLSGAGPVFWDMPGPAAASTLALPKHLGFYEQRVLTRMYLGENSTPGDPRKVFALAGPELG